MITAKVGFTFEDFAEGHPLHDFDGYFYVKANVHPGCKATYMQPGDPPEIEIIDAKLAGGTKRDRYSDCDLSEIQTIERAILDLINTDTEVRDHTYEKLWEDYQEARTNRFDD
jgi:hypothetical protein